MRYDRKAIFYYSDSKENALGDSVAAYTKIDAFDVAVTPFTNDETKLYGLEKINKMAKVLCRDRKSYAATLLFLLDEGSETEGTYYSVLPKKDLKKVFLFNCEVAKIEAESINNGD